MKTITKENLLRMAISLVAILSSILTPVLPAHGTSAVDRVWVQTQSRTGPRLGLLNASSGEITLVSGLTLTEGVSLISESFDGQYLAIATSVRTKISASQVIIVAKIRQVAQQIRLEPYTTLSGYSKAQWSPNTLELLLSRSNWSRVSIWGIQARAARETAPVTIDVDDVCDAAWGNTSNTVLISVCADERRLLSYNRDRQQKAVLISYNMRIQNDYAYYATLMNATQNRKKILLFTYTERANYPKNGLEMPVILTGRWMIFDTAEDKYEIVPRLFSSGSAKFGAFLSRDRILIIGQIPLSNTKSAWDYVQYSTVSQKINPLMLADRQGERMTQFKEGQARRTASMKSSFHPARWRLPLMLSLTEVSSLRRLRAKWRRSDKFSASKAVRARL